jgi:hypothetical protein
MSATFAKTPQRAAVQPVASLTTTLWHPLTSDAKRFRFAEIMRLMDRRYKNLSLDQLDVWLNDEARVQRPAELWGWFEGDADDVDNLRQVLAFTCRRDLAGRRSDLFLEMIGVAADVIPSAEWTAAAVETWYSRLVLQLKELAGLGETITAIRPRRMDFEPMQRLHDLVPAGFAVVAGDEPGAPSYRMQLDDERDKGDALFWRMRVVRVDES